MAEQIITKSCLKYSKKYQQTKKGKDVRKKAVRKYAKTTKSKATQKRYNIRHPKRRKARTAVATAIENGKLPRPDILQCHYCPKQAKQYHHWHGYAPEYWLDVVPICRDCHIIIG